MKKNNLSAEEREFEENIDKLRPISGKEREKIENILAGVRRSPEGLSGGKS